MAFVLKDGQGTLHRQDKGDNEKRPDYSGEAMIDGKLYRIAGWIKEGKTGRWISLKVTPPDSGGPAQRVVVRAKVDDDDLPY